MAMFNDHQKRMGLALGVSTVMHVLALGVVLTSGRPGGDLRRPTAGSVIEFLVADAPTQPSGFTPNERVPRAESAIEAPPGDLVGLHQAVQETKKPEPSLEQPVLPTPLPPPEAPKLASIVAPPPTRPAPVAEFAPDPTLGDGAASPFARPEAPGSSPGAASAHAPGEDISSNRAPRPSVPSGIQYVRTPKPSYPAAARRLRQEGLVVLAVQVDTRGRPARVEVRASSGFASLDAAAEKAVRRWEFAPARLGSQPISSEVEVPIRFSLVEEAGAS